MYHVGGGAAPGCLPPARAPRPASPRAASARAWRGAAPRTCCACPPLLSLRRCERCSALAALRAQRPLSLLPLSRALPRKQERQRQQCCLQHTLNNLLQGPRFSAAALNTLSDALGPGAAQRSRIPLWSGNWDANTLLAALATLQLVGGAAQRQVGAVGGRAPRAAAGAPLPDPPPYTLTHTTIPVCPPSHLTQPHPLRRARARRTCAGTTRGTPSSRALTWRPQA
jgi:hypothetical protein